MVRTRALCIFAAGAALSCRPDLDQRTSEVRAPRVLAVRAEPAEAPPLTPVTLSALVVDGSGALPGATLAWAYCDDRKPLAELGPVSARCLERAGDFFEELGSGPAVTGALPQKACREFGPEVPEAKDNQPAGRPVDPDPTGGYYQPVRLVATASSGEALVALGRARLSCGVVGPTPEQLTDLKKRTHPNVNPALDSVGDLRPDDATGGGAANVVTAGQRVTLRAAWAACAPDATACTGAEAYASFDPATQTVQSRREAMRLSWFATSGALDEDHTGRDESDAAPFSENVWTAPTVPGPAHLWVVIRDDRGGVGWRGFVVDVR